MTDEHEDTAESPVERRRLAAAPAGKESDSNINPYQAPAYHPDDAADGQSKNEAAPGPAFWLTAALMMMFTLVAALFTQGAALPLPFAVVLGTMRASALFVRQKQLPYRQLPAVMLLITSTFLALMLMFCCTIAFVVICTSGAIAAGMPGPLVAVWTVACIAAALAAFVFLFIRSMKWGV